MRHDPSRLASRVSRQKPVTSHVSRLTSTTPRLSLALDEVPRASAIGISRAAPEGVARVAAFLGNHLAHGLSAFRTCRRTCRRDLRVTRLKTRL